MSSVNTEQLLRELFQRAVDQASAANCMLSDLSNLSHSKIVVIGAGKAAAAMAKVIEDNVSAQTRGIVVTRYGHALPVRSIEVVEAAHPVPDKPSIDAARRIVDLVSSLGKDDFVICAMSGGASSLLSLPHPKIAFKDKQAICQQLLLSGADIEELNCVRKHLSAIKGGRLMQKIYPAQVLTLCISDVVGDDPSVIGSGPTVADSTICSDVLTIFDQYGLTVPKYILNQLKRGELETPKADSVVFDNADVRVVMRPRDALNASAELAKDKGLIVNMLGDAIAGDTNQIAKQHAALVRKILAQAPKDKPIVILSGGETTVNVSGSGQGGPNTQYALALALELERAPGVYAIACDTDGIDGSENNAGAIISPTTLNRASKLQLDPHRYLNDNDAYNFFDQLGDLVFTGPTLTNVNDFRAILILPGDSMRLS